jgi:PTS system mannitol-specific IIC component
VIRKFDEAVAGKVPAGFEMLVNNFSAGIIGMIITLLAYVAIGPVVLALNNVLKSGVQAIVNAGLLPLASILIEPGKILFLNNAINHGVLGPLGVQQVQEAGKSIFFLLETNPGPGLGILLAYWLVGRGTAKQSAPGAIIIHFLGGIHEIYFPYVLMKPVMLLAVIAGGMTGVFTFVVTKAGLVATPSPGSIFAEIAMAPKGGLLPVLLGIFLSAAVSFFVGSIILKRSAKDELDDLDSATLKVEELKGKKLSVSQVKTGKVSKIAVACDGGMGSSAMAASVIRKKIRDAGLNIEVINSSLEDLPKDVDIVITHKELTERAKKTAPAAEHISITSFVNNPLFDELVERLKDQL